MVSSEMENNWGSKNVLFSSKMERNWGRRKHLFSVVISRNQEWRLRGPSRKATLLHFN